MVTERLGATGAQLGRKLVVDGQEIVEYIAASEGREDMVGKVTYSTMPYIKICKSRLIASSRLFCGTPNSL